MFDTSEPNVSTSPSGVTPAPLREVPLAHTPEPLDRPVRVFSRYRGNVVNTAVAHRIEIAMYYFGVTTSDEAEKRCNVGSSVVRRIVGTHGGWEIAQFSTRKKLAEGLGMSLRFVTSGRRDARPEWFDDAASRLDRSKRNETVSGRPFVDTPLVHCFVDAMVGIGGCWLALEKRMSMTSQEMQSVLLRCKPRLHLNASQTTLLARLSGRSVEAVEAALNNNPAAVLSAPTAPEARQRPAVHAPAHAGIPPENLARATSPSPTPAPRTPQPADPPVTHAAAEPNMDLNLAKRAVAWLYATAPSPFIRDTAGMLLPALMSSDSRPA